MKVALASRGVGRPLVLRTSSAEQSAKKALTCAAFRNTSCLPWKGNGPTRDVHQSQSSAWPALSRGVLVTCVHTELHHHASLVLWTYGVTSVSYLHFALLMLRYPYGTPSGCICCLVHLVDQPLVLHSRKRTLEAEHSVFVLVFVILASTCCTQLHEEVARKVEKYRSRWP